jgi:hypothetical protein
VGVDWLILLAETTPGWWWWLVVRREKAGEQKAAALCAALALLRRMCHEIWAHPFRFPFSSSLAEGRKEAVGVGGGEP